MLVFGVLIIGSLVIGSYSYSYSCLDVGEISGIGKKKRVCG